jgi:hypothetical protein
MKTFRSALILSISLAVLAQQPASTPRKKIVLAAAWRDDSINSGGMSAGKRMPTGHLVVEPLAFVNEAGEWSSIPCDENQPKGCEAFQRNYLKAAHSYTVISADGNGATIHAEPTQLSECYDYSGQGSYSGGVISRAAIGASSADIFAESEPAKTLDAALDASVRKALERLIPTRLSSLKNLRLYSMKLEGKSLIVLQRGVAESEGPDYVFAIGEMTSGKFNVLHWKKDGDEEEHILATIALKSGRQFLIATEMDSEGHAYRIYGIRNGHLELVYFGGGASC